MKKYVVLQQILSFSPDMKEGFDELEDAESYTAIMKKAHPDRKYKIYQTVMVAE